MKNLKIKFSTLGIITVLIMGVFLLSQPFSAFSSEPETTMWKYQCIDTMKYSRDAARAWVKKLDYQKDIANEMTAIKDIGANCVAVGTPYDDEFIPYLTSWVNAARDAHLYVWFRGNFSGWEGWFDYPKGLTPDEQLSKIKTFILTHRELFADGDIFTPAPEAENGWNNGNNVSGNDYPAFRQFLINEKTIAHDAFSEIGKHIETNWLSMSGGVAKEALDQPTINALDKTVTLDHYVSSPDVMDEYVNYFHDTYHATFILGEFGAPIPDINGDMDETQQAAFVDSVFKALYKQKKNIYGVNYWVLSGGSTQLLNDNGSKRKVVEVIKKYYIPAIISGKVTNTMHLPLRNIEVKTSDGYTRTKTDSNGYYRLLIPAEDTIIDFENSDYKSAAREIAINKGGNYTQNITLEPYSQNFFYNLQLIIKGLFEQITVQVKSLFQR